MKNFFFQFRFYLYQIKKKNHR